jgi:hypothetical protein
MTIAGGLSATKTGFDLIRSIREILKRQEVEPAEISARLLELQELMLDARTALADAQEENSKLQARIDELSRMADFGKDFKAAHGVYWYEKFPYCPTCWDVDRRPVRLAGPKGTGEQYNQWTCPFHRVDFALVWNVRQEM